MTQFALPLPWPADDEMDDFILSQTNIDAVRHLDRRDLWPVMATVLAGPRKSGRSLLGRIFASQSGGMLIDDADRRDEEDLFHAWNHAQAERRPLLLVVERPLPSWQVDLPDLRSRLAATPSIGLGDPDDALALALLERQLGARGLVLPRTVGAFIVARIDRTHVTIARVVDALAGATLAHRRGLTVPLARKTLLRGRFIDASRDME